MQAKVNRFSARTWVVPSRYQRASTQKIDEALRPLIPAVVREAESRDWFVAKAKTTDPNPYGGYLLPEGAVLFLKLKPSAFLADGAMIDRQDPSALDRLLSSVRDDMIWPFLKASRSRANHTDGTVRFQFAWVPAFANDDVIARPRFFDVFLLLHRAELPWPRIRELLAFGQVIGASKVPKRFIAEIDFRMEKAMPYARRFQYKELFRSTSLCHVAPRTVSFVVPFANLPARAENKIKVVLDDWKRHFLEIALDVEHKMFDAGHDYSLEVSEPVWSVVKGPGSSSQSRGFALTYAYHLGDWQEEYDMLMDRSHRTFARAADEWDSLV